MDFNTGSSPEEATSSGGPSRGSGGPPRDLAGTPGREFNYRDPVQSFIGTVRNVVTAPVAFFRSMTRQGDFINPLIYALICALILAIIGGLLAILGAIVGIGNMGVGEAIGAFAASLFLTPIFWAIGLFIGAGITHLLVMLIVKPVSTGFETTFRVNAYSSTAQLVGWVPIIGPLVAAVAAVVLAIFGIREAHATTTGKAALVILIPVAIVVFLAIVLAAIVGAVLFNVLSQ